MGFYSLSFKNPAVQDYISAEGYSRKCEMFNILRNGDSAAAHHMFPEYIEELAGLYRKLDLEEVKECVLLMLIEVCTIAVLNGIGSWDVNRKKRNYYLGIEYSCTHDDLVKINRDYLYDFVNASEEHLKKARYSPLISQIQDYISKNIEEKFTLDMLARTFHSSISRITHRFKNETGIPIMEYVMKQKISVAKPLIRQNLPLSQISQQLGFSSQSHFSKTFRAVTGQSPLEWKQNPV